MVQQAIYLILSMKLDINQLTTLIGQETVFQGHRYRVVEILEVELAVILEATDQQVVQEDQYGENSRCVARSFVIPVYGPDGETLNTGFSELELISLE
ncbi:MAG TPA: hypothetical protein DCZ03_04405 [Gammaproteobacteria bacterium]|nr:hypothetical protein [Gammaproteobacteria bacterium]